MADNKALDLRFKTLENKVEVLTHELNIANEHIKYLLSVNHAMKGVAVPILNINTTSSLAKRKYMQMNSSNSILLEATTKEYSEYLKPDCRSSPLTAYSDDTYLEPTAIATAAAKLVLVDLCTRHSRAVQHLQEFNDFHHLWYFQQQHLFLDRMKFLVLYIQIRNMFQ